MSEASTGIAEPRASNPFKIPIKDSSIIRSNSQPTRNSLIGRLRDTLTRKLLSEEPFKPEDYTGQQIATDILRYTRNPLRERAGTDPYANPFDKRTILSNKGQVLSMNKPNSPAYRAVSQSLEELVRGGALGADYQDPHHGESRYYWVLDLKRLKEIAEREGTVE